MCCSHALVCSDAMHSFVLVAGLCVSSIQKKKEEESADRRETTTVEEKEAEDHSLPLVYGNETRLSRTSQCVQRAVQRSRATRKLAGRLNRECGAPTSTR
jgi:hypothetical protein